MIHTSNNNRRFCLTALIGLCLVLGMRLAEPSYLPATGSNIGIGTSTPVGGFVVMNGNAGIGTWSPTSKLQVVGTVAATAFSGDGSGLSNVPSSSGWTDGGTNVYSSTTTDLVAVGTTTPASTLTVKGNVGIGTTTPYRTIAAPANGMTVEGNVGIGTFAAASGKLIVMNGNVGIGATSPTASLDVPGTVALGSEATYTGTTTLVQILGNNGTGAPLLLMGPTGAMLEFVDHAGASKNWAAGILDDSSAFTVFEDRGNGFSAGTERLRIAAGGNVGIGTTTPVGALTVMNGNVGIGTWSPVGKLEVRGGSATRIWTGNGTDTNALAAGELYVEGDLEVDGTIYGDGSGITALPSTLPAGGWVDGGANVYLATTTDFVGIGTTSPQGILHVGNATNGTIFFEKNAGGNGGYFGLSEVQFGANRSYPIYFLTGGTNRAAIIGGQDANSTNYLSLGAPNEAMRIDASGNIGVGTITPVAGLAVMNGNAGIGTWSPTSRLQVVGTVAATAFSGDGSALTNLPASGGWNDGGTNVYTSTTTDNVGIGTTTPTAALLLENAGTQASFRVNDAVLDGSPFIIDSAGNVGIGTTSPVYPLEVIDNSAANHYGMVINHTGPGGSYASGLRVIQNSGGPSVVAIAGEMLSTSGVGVMGNASAQGGGAGIGVFGISDGTADGIGVLGQESGTSNTGYAVQAINNSATGWGVYSSGTSPNYFAGNVGIGTSAPRGGLVVASGNVGIGTLDPLGALTVMNGNVGIGTWSPTSRLQVVGTVAATAFSGDGSALTNVPSSSGWTDGGTNVYVSPTTDNVAIGTTTPASTLTVIGNIGIGTTTQYRTIAGPINGMGIEGNVGIGTWAAASGKLIVMNGNVGIGTTAPVGGLIVMNGNAGIGTWSPTSRLQVVGTVAATAFSGDGSALTNLPGGASGWTDGGANVYTTATTDNLGIGTTTPNAATLEIVKNAAQPVLKISSTATGGGDYLIINSQGNVGIGTSAPVGALVILNGNVGVGTTSPTAKLQVTGVADDATAIATSSAGGSGAINLRPDGTNGNVIRFGGSGGGASILRFLGPSDGEVGRFDVTQFTSQGGLNAAGGYINFGGYVALSRIAEDMEFNRTGVGNGHILFFTSAANSPVERVRITSQGNVGIATVTANSRLVINGGVGIGTLNSSTFINTAAPSGGLIVEKNVGVGTTTPVGGLTVMNGNAGIGTWSPTSKLQVVGTVAATAFSGDGSALTNLPASGGWSDGGTNVYTSTTTDNVGIGTTTPNAATLEIVKNAAQSALKVSSSATAGGDYFLIKSDGNVGIGTITPRAGLVVMNGNVGIGTTSPVSSLDIRTNDSTVPTLFVGTYSSTIVPSIRLQRSGVSGFDWLVNNNGALSLVEIGYPSSPLMTFSYGGNRDIFISEAKGGNVGIGTTSATVALLSVDGETYIAGPVGMGTFAPTGMLDIRQDEVRIWTGAGTSTNATAAGELYVEGDLEVDGTIYGDGSGLTGASGLTAAGGWTDGGANVFTSTTTDTVGMGTTTASATLEIVKQSSSAPVMISSTATGDGDYLIVKSDGNVGIGTVAPRGAMVVMNGSVGIGTTAPAAVIDTVGHVNGSALIMQRSIGGVGLSLNLGSNGYTGLGFNVYRADASDAYKSMKAGRVGVLNFYNTDGTLSYFTGTASAPGENLGLSAPFVITGAGNVGIGNDTPTGGLIVNNGNVGIGTNTPVSGVGIMNGNVGIGTWSPTSKLQVVGTVAATAFTGDGSGLTGISAGGWTDGGTNVYTSTTTDNVAIGTTTPASTLTVVGNAGIGTTTPYRTIAAPANGMTVEGNVGIGTFAVASGKLLVMGGNMGIGTVSPVGAMIVMNGNVGFGTISPTAALEVKGPSAETGATLQNISSSTGGSYFRFVDSGAANITGANYGSLSIRSTHGSGSSSVTFQSEDGTPQAGMSFSNPNDILNFGTSVPLAVTISSNAVERLRITSSGEFGIGTTIPVGGLAVMNGNVGIGTWSPTSKLQVVGTVAATAFTGDGSGLTGISAGGWTDGGANVYASATTDNVAIGTTTPASTLTVVGNIGIGTTAPYRTIAGPTNGIGVAGNVGIGTWAAANGKLIVVGGNVGIGTTTPVGALTVMSGNVGIGTWVPSSTLEVKTVEVLGFPALKVRDYADGGGVRIQSVNAGPFKGIAANGYYYTSGVYRSDTNDAAYIDLSGGAITFKGDGSVPANTDYTPTTRMVIASNGNVGIGTTNPVGGLTVMSGNVGIGTWMPRARLEIKNTLSFSSVYDNGNSGTSITVDWNLGNLQKVTMTGNCTFTFTAPGSPSHIALKLVQDGTGSRTATWPAAVKWSGGAAPTLTTTATTGTDLISCLWDGSIYMCSSSLDFR